MIKMRGNSFQLYRRVPKRFAPIEPRTFVWLSLHTDSKSVAERKASSVWAEMVEAWEAKLAGNQPDAQARFEAARELAAVRGFRYLDAKKVAELPIAEVMARVERLPERKSELDQLEGDALLGGADDTGITISGALDAYWKLAATKTLGKSEDQVRRWKNPRIKAINNLISIIGDKTLKGITGDDMLDFREWWSDRIMNDGVSFGSANKDFTHIGDVLKTVNTMKRLGLVLPLSDLRFKNSDTGTRPPFSGTWIKDRILADGALDGLNDQARAILIVMVNTGARPSEIAALTRDCIRLDHDVPHISIEATERQLKSKNAQRVIPLTGASLEAAKAFPLGFERYRGSSASLSATVNKFLRSNGLCETPGHSMYSLRHSFEDRLLAADVDERIRRDLLGHALNRERYGKGASLEHMHEVVSKVAL